MGCSPPVENTATIRTPAPTPDFVVDIEELTFHTAALLQTRAVGEVRNALMDRGLKRDLIFCVLNSAALLNDELDLYLKETL